MPVERIVALLTPLFAAVAGLVTTVVARAVPGVSFNKADVTALFIAGATAAASAALKWLHGRQKFVQFTGDVEHVVDVAVAKVRASPQAAPAAAELEAVLRSHTDQIVAAIGSAVHASPSAEQIAQAIVRAAVAPASPVAQPPVAPSA